ncbi:stage V sporulation protein AB [Mesobacillus persicus]|uniref:Stage V sporulation protein AB n=1 Tax=Mesobacillus persicus TaxID=930146 RepID=A0A1H8BVK3_9BACI|nr:stage V sporulation protein AB [Mesobacillus persicus]SEM86895.1 stage V sporulation protein AB [Mesobacillus persicus]
MTIEILFVFLVSLAGGLAVGAGFVAFLVVLGVIPRLTQLTKTMRMVYLYEWAVVLGAIAGTFGSLQDLTFNFTGFLSIPIGLFAGTFVGMLAAGLTEALNVFPILAKRIRIEDRIVILIMAIVIGKVLGSLFQWVYFVG